MTAARRWWNIRVTRWDRAVVLLSAVITPTLLIIDLTRGGW